MLTLWFPSDRIRPPLSEGFAGDEVSPSFVARTLYPFPFSFPVLGREYGFSPPCMMTTVAPW
jgi:hypothetical protein